MWLFQHKYHDDGSLSRYKARLVADRRSQQFGVAYDDTFSLVIKTATIHTVHMANCNSTRTPVDTKSKLSFDGDLIYDPTLYHSLASDSLVAYTDTNWAGCPTTRRSTSGYYVFLRDNLLSWSAKRQNTISRSSAEAEYRGFTNVVAETVWLRNLLKELHTPLLSVTLVYCDNVSAIYMTANSVQHHRTKHIEIDIHFVCDMVACGQVRVLHVPSRYQYADIFTKGLSSELLEELRTNLSVWPSPAQFIRITDLFDYH
nr:ribonuclease H-like domain-containing protein [Tanacetum cinerariifolium]